MNKAVYSPERVAFGIVSVDPATTPCKKLKQNVNGTWWDVTGAVLHECGAPNPYHKTLQKPSYIPAKRGGYYECTNCGARIKDPD